MRWRSRRALVASLVLLAFGGAAVLLLLNDPDLRNALAAYETAAR
jgi:hypothetical protein